MDLTGDLAYIATILGKDNSSGWHCPYCKLGHSKWQCKGHELGELWTLDGLFATSLEVQTSGKKKLGVTQQPLMTTIGVDRITPPWLHIMMGVISTLLWNMQTYIQWIPQLEDLPSPIEESRKNFLLMLDYQLALESLTEWSTINQLELLSLVAKKKEAA